jgi:predicted DNA-binding transcriptional regulator AlpA
MTCNITETPDRLLTETEAAELLGFSKNTLRAWRVTGRPRGNRPPSFVKCGRAVRYRLSGLIEWMNAQPSHTSTSDPGGVPCAS